MYTFAISEHLENFLLSLGMGFLLGILYDVVRIIRLIVSKGKAALFVFDFLYLGICAILTYLFMIAINMGAVRAYIIIAELMGFFFYYISFGIVVIRISDKIIELIRKAAAKTAAVLKKPFSLIKAFFSRLFSKSAGLMKKNLSKNKKNLKKVLHNNKVSLYNLHGIFSSSKKSGK